MTIGRNLTLKEFQRYISGLPDALEKAVVRGIRVGANRALSIVVAAGDHAEPASEHGKDGAFDTGSFRSGWRVRNLPDGAAIENIRGHAAIIEEGRRPGSKPPTKKVIEKWLVRRGGLSQAEAKLAAYPVARSIGRRGLAGRHPLEHSTPEIVRVVLEEVKREVKAAAEGRTSR